MIAQMAVLKGGLCREGVGEDAWWKARKLVCLSELKSSKEGSTIEFHWKRC